MLSRLNWTVVARAVTRFALRAVLPALLLLLLALLSGLLRTTALGAFALVVALKGAMTGLDLLAEYAPTPHYRMEVTA